MKFKEINTGLIYEFTQVVDIISMQAHPEYEEIEEVELVVEVKKETTKTK